MVKVKVSFETKKYACVVPVRVYVHIHLLVGACICICIRTLQLEGSLSVLRSTGTLKLSSWCRNWTETTLDHITSLCKRSYTVTVTVKEIRIRKTNKSPKERGTMRGGGWIEFQTRLGVDRKSLSPFSSRFSLRGIQCSSWCSLTPW